MKIYDQLGLTPKQYRLATLHRAETTDGGLEAVTRIFRAFEQLPQRVVIPIHPRTRALAEKAIAQEGFRNIQLIDPVGYLEMLLLTSAACQVLTDSGGLQKEAYFMEVPCVTLRTENRVGGNASRELEHFVLADNGGYFGQGASYGARFRSA